MCAGKDYPHPMVCHIEASQRNLGLMRQVRTEQQNTAELTRGKTQTVLTWNTDMSRNAFKWFDLHLDVADDPMEAGLKRELQEEEEELLEGVEQHSTSKRFNGVTDHKSCPCSWTPETLQLSGEVM